MNPKVIAPIVGFGLLLPAFVMSGAIVLVGLWIVSFVRILDDRSDPHRLRWLAFVIFLGPLGCILYFTRRSRDAYEPLLPAFHRPRALG